MNTHDHYMHNVLNLAQKAFELDEVPIAAIIVDSNDNIISEAFNSRENTFDPCGHAEVNCLRNAGLLLKSWNLRGCSLYVNLEPCVMCMGALVNARISQLIFGAWDYKGGSISNHQFHPFENNLNHQVQVISGILEQESIDILQKFFQNKRANSKKTEFCAQELI